MLAAAQDVSDNEASTARVAALMSLRSSWRTIASTVGPAVGLPSHRRQGVRQQRCWSGRALPRMAITSEQTSLAHAMPRPSRRERPTERRCRSLTALWLGLPAFSKRKTTSRASGSRPPGAVTRSRRVASLGYLRVGCSRIPALIPRLGCGRSSQRRRPWQPSPDGSRPLCDELRGAFAQPRDRGRPQARRPARRSLTAR